LPSLITLIAAYEALEKKKPAPDVYFWALDRLALGFAGLIAIEVTDYTSNNEFTGASAIFTGLAADDPPALSLHGPRPGTRIVDLAFPRTAQGGAVAARAACRW
jgi:hypothetical protein